MTHSTIKRDTAFYRKLFASIYIAGISQEDFASALGFAAVSELVTERLRTAEVGKKAVLRELKAQGKLP